MIDEDHAIFTQLVFLFNVINCLISSRHILLFLVWKAMFTYLYSMVGLNTLATLKCHLSMCCACELWTTFLSVTCKHRGRVHVIQKENKSSRMSKRSMSHVSSLTFCKCYNFYAACLHFFSIQSLPANLHIYVDMS